MTAAQLDLLDLLAEFEDEARIFAAFNGTGSKNHLGYLLCDPDAEIAHMRRTRPSGPLDDGSHWSASLTAIDLGRGRRITYQRLRDWVASIPPDLRSRALAARTRYAHRNDRTGLDDLDAITGEAIALSLTGGAA